jgi:hypothetical protein
MTAQRLFFPLSGPSIYGHFALFDEDQFPLMAEQSEMRTPLCPSASSDSKLCRETGLGSERDPIRDAIPEIKTDVSRIDELRDAHFLEEGYKCLDCNRRGCTVLRKTKNLQEAYNQFKMGMLGTGESDYSKLMTQYFNECLENFCAQGKIEDSVDKFKLYVNEISKRAMIPEYSLLRKVLSELVQESRKARRTSEAIQFQKEEIFFTMLEGSRNDDLGEDCEQYCLPLEGRIAEGIEKLHNLMPAGL